MEPALTALDKRDSDVLRTLRKEFRHERSVWLAEAQLRWIRPIFFHYRVNDRRVISGIIFVIRNGLRWRDAPAAYGPPNWPFRWHSR
jgi:transposase